MAILLPALLLAIPGRSQGTWTPVTNAAPHYNAGVMILLTDGTVLCKTSSGGTSYGLRWDKLTPNASGSYANGTWTTIAPMADERLYFSSQVLNDGRVYVAGGEYGSGGTKGEVYDPRANTWTACPLTSFFISDANSMLLPDGRVLQAIVGSGTKHNRIWDPATNTYALAPDCLRLDNEATWVKLPDNSTIFIDNYGTTSERYIPATNTWINDATLPVSLYDPYGKEAGGAFLLPDGRVWFIGATPTSAYYTPSGSTAPGTWATGPAIPFSQGAPDAAASIMPNGKILMAISQTPTAADHFPDSTVFYEFDYLTNTYIRVNAPGIPGDTMIQPAYITNMLSLPDGSILFANQGDDQYYTYTPSGPQLAAGKPTVDSVIRLSCDTFMAIGKLFNGITEGASYGDDWQMSTNYPLVRFRSGTNVYYAKTYGWNRIGAVMTGSLLDTTKLILPATMPQGMYTMELVVNGIPSAGRPFNYSSAVTPATSTVCAGTSTTLTDVWPGGAWSTGNTTIATVVGATGFVTGAGNGAAVITYTLGVCTATATVNVVPATAPITPAGPATVCTGTITQLSDITPGGTWSSSNAAVASVNVFGLASTLSQGNATISYSNGCGTATYAMTVNNAPATITGGSMVCAGSTTSVADASTGGTWSSSNPSIATVDASGNVFTVAQGSTTITYANGCGTPATAAITAKGAPTAISGPALLCAGSTAALSDAAVGGTWSSSNAAVASVNVSGVASALTQGATTITFDNGCGTATHILSVNAIPGAISGITAMCSGGGTTVLSNSAAGGTWSSSNPAAVTIDPMTGVATGGIGSSATITYDNGCGAPASALVSINTPPSTPSAITGAAALCAGTATPLNDATASGIWSTDNTAIAGISTSGVVSGLSAGVVTVSYTLTNTCGSAAATKVITVNPQPDPGVISGAPASVCQGASALLSSTSPGGVWSSNHTAIAVISSSGIVTGAGGGSATIFYTVTNSCGTMATTYIVSIDPLPVIAPVTAALSSVCAGANITVNNATPGGVWSSATPGIAVVSASGVVTGVMAGVATISYAVSNTCGTSAVTKDVTVLTIPAPGIITGSATVCMGQTMSLSNATAGGLWTSDIAGIAPVNASSGVVTGMAPGTDTIRYFVVNSCGSAFVKKVITVLSSNDAACAGLGVAAAANGTPALKVFPNPNEGTFTLTMLSGKDEEATVTISNVLGAKVRTFTIPTNKAVDVTLHVAPGVYLLSVALGDDRYTTRVVVSGK